MEDGCRIYSCGLYYETEGLRELCHAVKDGRREAYSDAVWLLADVVDKYGLEGCSFIPIPNHGGKPDYTLRLLNDLSGIRRIHVLDVLEGKERETLYSIKKGGNDVSREDLGFRLMRRIHSDNVVLFDNVVDTGITYASAMKAIGMKVPIMALAQVHPDSWY